VLTALQQQQPSIKAVLIKACFFWKDAGFAFEIKG
jgi:hypothetical protein